MTSRSLILSAAALLAFASAAAAGVTCPPLADGDDSGCAPPDKLAYRCETKAAKEALKLAIRVGECHISKADRPVVFDEEGCEDAARAKFDNAFTKLANEGCPACLSSNASNLKGDVGDTFDLLNGLTFCEGTTPFGVDDKGFIPTSNLSLACGRRLTRSAGTLGKAFTRCHQRAAAGDLQNKPFDEEACENEGIAKYQAVLDEFFGRHPHCPPCGPSNESSLRGAVAAFFDGAALGQSYCAP